MMATLQDILSPQARIDGLAQTPLTDPLGGTSGVSALPATILQSSGTAFPASVMDASGVSAFSGPGPIGLQPHPVPSLSTRVPTPGRALYGPSRILGETYGGGAGMGTMRAPTDPNAGLASRIAQAATSPEAAPSGFLATPTGRGIRAVLYGLGQTLPATSRGLTGVLGSAARGFTATVDDLQAQRAQQAEAQQAAQQRAFQSQLGQAQLGLTQAQTNAYTALANQRQAGADDPGNAWYVVTNPGERPYKYNRSTGETAWLTPQPGDDAPGALKPGQTVRPFAPKAPPSKTEADKARAYYLGLLAKKGLGELPMFTKQQAVAATQQQFPYWTGPGATGDSGGGGPTQQQYDWDAAAAAIAADRTGKYAGKSATDVLGPRP